jgi:hypothetical protein
VEAVGVVDVAVVVVVLGGVRIAGASRLVQAAATSIAVTTKTASSRRRIALLCLAVAELVPTCVWRLRPEVVIALDDRFGEPVDAYVNGSQVWLREDGPGGITLEWRLHPVAGFERPPGITTHDLFPSIALSLATDEEPVTAAESLWDGLEVYAAYGDEVEPATLAAAATASLGIAPDAAGLADHDSIADAWESNDGRVSIVNALLEQLDETG